MFKCQWLVTVWIADYHVPAQKATKRLVGMCNINLVLWDDYTYTYRLIMGWLYLHISSDYGMIIVWLWDDYRLIMGWYRLIMGWLYLYLHISSDAGEANTHDNDTDDDGYANNQHNGYSCKVK